MDCAYLVFEVVNIPEWPYLVVFENRNSHSLVTSPVSAAPDVVGCKRAFGSLPKPVTACSENETKVTFDSNFLPFPHY